MVGCILGLTFNSYGHIMAVRDAHVFPGFLTPVLTQLSFQNHRLLFSHASAEVTGEYTPERKFSSTGSQTHNHQVMSPTRSLLSHLGGAQQVPDGRSNALSKNTPGQMFNSLPDDKLDWFKLKVFADDKINVGEKFKFSSTLWEKEKMLVFAFHLCLPFPRYILILNVKKKSFRKTLWKMVKLLKMSNLTFFFPQCFVCNLYLKILQ